MRRTQLTIIFAVNNLISLSITLHVTFIYLSNNLKKYRENYLKKAIVGETGYGSDGRNSS